MIKLISTATIANTTSEYGEFTNIPQNYKDLLIIGTARNNRTSAIWGYQYLSFNSETYPNATQFMRKITWTSSNASSYQTNTNSTGWGFSTDYQTANVLGYVNLLITNYSITGQKPMLHYDGNANNASGTDAANTSWSGISRSTSTSAITSIKFGTADGQLLKQGSMFYLYGIA